MSDGDMWQRLTTPATRVIHFAQEEAKWQGVNVVGTEHLLLGMLREGEGVAAHVLGHLKVTLTQLRIEIDRQTGPAQTPITGSARLTLCPVAKKALENALLEARELNPKLGLLDFVDTEHLLLGLLREDTGMQRNKALLLLAALGVDAARIRGEVMRYLGVEGSKTQVADLETHTPLADLRYLASMLRADLPAVAHLREHAHAEQWIAFERDLLAYMRERREPRPFFDPAQAPAIMRRIAETDPAGMAITESMANHALKWEFPNNNNWNWHIVDYVKLDADYDFRGYPSSDPELAYSMNRLQWVPELAKMYRATGDEQYLHGCLEQWGWYIARAGYPTREDYEREDNPNFGIMKLPHHRLDAFVRLTNLWWTYWLLLTAEALEPADHAWMLAHLLRLHEMVLAHGPMWLRSNWASMQYESQYLTALLLPEFIGMEASANLARVGLEESLRQAFYPDGLHYEQSPDYGLGCLSWYGHPLLLGLRNGRWWSPEYRDILRNAFQAYDRLATPDGAVPNLGDSDPSPVAPFLTLGKALFHDLPLVNLPPPNANSYWYGAPETEEAPAVPPRCSVFPTSGLAVVRDGGTYLTFDCGPRGGGHGHFDLLAVQYWLHGKLLLADAGRWLYADDPLREWVMSPAGHNTVSVDGRAMAAIEDPHHPALEPMLAREADGQVLLTAAHHAFDAPGSRATCRRYLAIDPAAGWLLVVDELTAESSCAWRQHWLFPTTEVTLAEQTVTVAGQARLLLHGGSPRLSPCEWSPIYFTKAPAATVQATAEGSRVVLAMLLLPDGMDGEMELAAEAWSVRIRVNGDMHAYSAGMWEQG